MRILAVDDNPVNIKVVSQFLLNQGYEVITAASGEEAIEKFQSESPELILMDIMMPGMNGHEATTRIKELSGNRWVPVIFMSALSREEDKVKGLEVGGDDYVTKPVEFSILAAKITAMQRIAEMQSRLTRTMDELERYQQEAETEQETAHELMNRLFAAGHIESENLRIWHQPATRFSGDLVIAARSPGNRIYLLQADSTGHGLTAALPLLPVAQTFYELSRKGLSVGQIVKKMNAQLKEFMPVNRFLALTMVLIDSNNNIVEVWNGGNPPMFLINDKGDVIHRFDSKHLALGILSDESFDMSTEFAKSEGVSTAVLCSDGLAEAANAAGEDFGEARLIECFKTSSQPSVLVECIVNTLEQHLGDAKAHDDVSLLVVSSDAGKQD